MPHQCIKCNTFYKDGAKEILSGCKCGGKMFFFIKKEKLEQAKNFVNDMSEEDKKQIEEDVLDIMSEEKGPSDDTVVLDLETVRISKPGQYELDLVQLFKGQPLIYKVDEGKYIIDLVQSFKKSCNKQKKKS